MIEVNKLAQCWAVTLHPDAVVYSNACDPGQRPLLIQTRNVPDPIKSLLGTIISAHLATVAAIPLLKDYRNILDAQGPENMHASLTAINVERCIATMLRIADLAGIELDEKNQKG